MAKRRRRQISGTQMDSVKGELLAGKTITTVDLINKCGGAGGWRLGAIIHALARDKNDPWPIQRRYEGIQRIAHYRLAPGFKPGARQLDLLRFLEA